MEFSIRRTFFLFFFIAVAIFAKGEEPIMWELNSLSAINGNSAEAKGSAKIIDSEIGQAVEFSKSPDQLLVKNNPLGDTKEWTIETIINPYSVSENSLKTPRYFHIQNPSDDTRRITMELRFNGDGAWYFDGFIKSPVNSLTLVDEKLSHPVDKWYNIAITYANDTFTSYVNGEKELTGEVHYESIDSDGVVSLGCRMNKVSYFKGAISKIIFSKSVLTPDKFNKSHLGKTTIFQTGSRYGSTFSSIYPSLIFMEGSLLPEKGYRLNGSKAKRTNQLPSISSGVIFGVVSKNINSTSGP